MINDESGNGAPKGSTLPYPEPPFSGRIARLVADSVPDFPTAVEPPKDAPNVLLILTDDVGIGASSTFAGPIPTPNFDRGANAGLEYTTFHTTAPCSPDTATLTRGL